MNFLTNVSHNKLLEDINKYNNCGDVDFDLGIELRFNEIYDEETFNQGSFRYYRKCFI